MLQEIPEPNRALAELRRVLAPAGVLSVDEAFPDPDYPFSWETIRRVEAAGFRLAERHGNFWEYTLNFRRVAGGYTIASAVAGDSGAPPAGGLVVQSGQAPQTGAPESSNERGAGS